MNADPAVMEHFPSTLSTDQSATLIARIEDCFERHGYGLWAIEMRSSADFAGFVGLWPVEMEVPFAPAVEIGWRLARELWGRGYAAEAALAALDFGFDRLGLEEIVSFTAVVNARSQRLMERLGMRRDPSGGFEHPMLPAGDRLRPHVLYRIGAREHLGRRASRAAPQP